MFQGSIVALVTPFNEDLEPDYAALEQLVEFQLERGTAAIVPCGTTGESATLTAPEHDRVVETVCRAVNGRVPVIAGAGSNATHEAVARSRHAASCGATAVLSVVPYYNKPPQEGLYRHFATIAREGGLPVVLYNVPSRTSCNLAADTVCRLAELTEVVAIKEASGDMNQVASILARTDIDVLSGDDPATLAMMAMGATGVVSVTANVHPAGVAAQAAAALEGDWDEARRLHERLLPLHHAMFVEPNPIPVKAAVALLGRCNGRVRLPLVELSEERVEPLRALMSELEVL